MKIEIDEKLIPAGWGVDRFAIPARGEFVIRGKAPWPMVIDGLTPELILRREQPRRRWEIEETPGSGIVIFDLNATVRIVREIQPRDTRCNFSGWASHYIVNVWNAAQAWMDANPLMKGTALYVQMEDMAAEAKKASGL